MRSHLLLCSTFSRLGWPGHCCLELPSGHFQSPIIVTTQKPPPYMFNYSPDSAGQDIVVQSCQAAHFRSQIIGKLRSHLLTCSTFLQTRLARTFLYRAAKRSFFKVPSLEKMRSHLLLCSTFSRLGWPGHCCLELPSGHFQSPIIVTTQKPPPYMFNYSPDSAGQDIVVQSCQAAHFQSQIIGKLRSHLLTCSTFLQTRLARTILYRAVKRSFFKVPSLEKLRSHLLLCSTFSRLGWPGHCCLELPGGHFQSPIIGKTQKSPPYLLNFSPDSVGQDISVQSCQAAHFQSPIFGKLRRHLFTCSTFLQTRLARTFLFRAAKRRIFKVPSLEKLRSHLLTCSTSLQTRLARYFLFRAAKQRIFTVPSL